MPDLLGSVFRLNERYIMGALEGTAQRFERALVRTDGTVGHTFASYVPDLGPDGTVRGFMAIVADITPLRAHR